MAGLLPPCMRYALGREFHLFRPPALGLHRQQRQPLCKGEKGKLIHRSDGGPARQPFYRVLVRVVLQSASQQGQQDKNGYGAPVHAHV